MDVSDEEFDVVKEEITMIRTVIVPVHLEKETVDEKGTGMVAI